MYLKAINAHGFKSFADKINIELDKNITGIVGPNGSGKSNVVDAVRWVLGEQSVKSLRGDGNMTDVIFSGSKSRNPLSVASVTLIFDNSDNKLSLQFDEIALKRRVYKDGTNEYFINNEKVRLKDVTNLLMDSGVAKESFNIISQGKIEEILSNKPEDRRIIFEEASGVLKYKKRKEEALRKLDKTHDNMNRINDIINELENRLEPLRIDREKAIKYNEINTDLENIDISLITTDITDLNYKYHEEKEKIEKLRLEIESLETNNTLEESKITKYKTNLIEIENQIKDNQTKLIELTKQVEQLNSRKNIILERKKYNVENTKVHENLLLLKEKQLNLNLEINNLLNDNKSKENIIMDFCKKVDNLNLKLNEIKKDKSNIVNNLQNCIREKTNLNYRIENLKSNIDNNSSVPYAVKKILDNPKLDGIHDIVGNIFDCDEKYSIAIVTALGSNVSNIVVNDDENAKEAIKYLKNNKIGRATFYPLNLIKPKSIDDNTLYLIKKYDFYIGCANELICYDKKYLNIILNLLGNIIVVDNIDNANKLAKIINHKYRIVTLDGQLLNVGGSLSGGSINKNKNIILEKYELENELKRLDSISNNISDYEEKINEIDNKYKEIEDKIYLENKNKMGYEVILENNSKNIINLKEHLKEISFEITGNENILNNKLDNEEQKVLNDYYETLEFKNKISLALEELVNKKNNLNSELTDYEMNVKKGNNEYNEKKNLLNNLEISVNRLDVKLDTLLNDLSEKYSLTYETAIARYKLDMDVDSARNKVSILKKQLKEIGVVNLLAIEEYDKVNERYEFLDRQRNDLIKAENTLLEIISEMDKVMQKEFLATFKVIKENFNITFKELFKGGEADLKLTNPDNILETGIDIIACPPGKKLTTISLLSGGEKTFTAISLLFAILKSKPVPFCILDEVEAALDDVNVDSFGKYISNLKEKTQFIIITHKKKTMEYVDTLYGITMQESGVSKLVSVKLEEIK